jgi:hypothetical protein
MEWVYNSSSSSAKNAVANVSSSAAESHDLGGSKFFLDNNSDLIPDEWEGKISTFLTMIL